MRWQCALGVLCLAVAAMAQEEAEQKARQEFSKLGESTSLLWDANTLRRWCGLEGDDILPRLLELYTQPFKPEPHFRYLVASCLRGRFDPRRGPFSPIGTRAAQAELSPEDQELLSEFLDDDSSGPIDAWAVYNVCQVMARRGFAEEDLLGCAFKDKRMIRRTTAIEALSRSGDARLVVRLPELLAEKPRKKHERALLIEAAALAACDWAQERLQPDTSRVVTPAEHAAAKALLEPVIELLEDRKQLERSERLIRIGLRDALGTERAYENADSWRLALQDATAPLPRGAEGTVVRFMGIEASGTRIAFLLDASDSMLNPLSDAEKLALEELFGGQEAAEGGRDTRARNDPLAVDWEGVSTRFDAAREHLKHTLATMDEDVSFAVILFGNDAEVLAETPSFVKANKKRKLAVALALDAIQPGPTNTARPHGTLRGQTNILAGFDLAFRVGKGGVVGAGTPLYTDRDALLEGVDTVFLLSDGKPSRDGFQGQSPETTIGGFWREAYETEITDPETGLKRPVKVDRQFIPERTQRLSYGFGPYLQNDALLEELERLNLFRKAVFHAIGIGEADRSLPERIAALGRGRWVDLGGAAAE